MEREGEGGRATHTLAGQRPEREGGGRVLTIIIIVMMIPHTHTSSSSHHCHHFSFWGEGALCYLHATLMHERDHVNVLHSNVPMATGRRVK